MGSDSCQNFVNRVMSLRQDILDCGGVCADHEVITVLLNGVPHQQISDDFHQLVMRLNKELKQMQRIPLSLICSRKF